MNGNVETIVINNWKGAMTNFQNGDMNSGRSYVQVVSGANPFAKPGTLTWNNAAVQINPTEDVITDLIMAGKERVESGVLYVYAIGHTGRLYKIQVNDPTTYNPDYDNPVLIATLAVNSPTFTRGGFIDFYGTTQKIYIGHDKGVTSINFDGSGEAFVGVLASWKQNVPRPIKQFLGKMYIGNEANLAEIDSSLTVTSYTKLSPGFPANSQVRDIDVTPDGIYLQAVVSTTALNDITAYAQNSANNGNADSFIFKWNGTDTGYTAFDTFPSYSLTANTTFGPYQYTFGYDQYGSAVYNPVTKIISGTEAQSPLPNAVAGSGNMVMYMQPLYFDGVMECDLNCWGNFDFEVGYPGYWDLMYINAKAPETDVVLCPFLLPVSNASLGASSNGYANNVFSVSKMYFSTMETSSAPSTKYRLYKWSPNTSADVPNTNVLEGAVYQTQTQLFSKKIQIKEVRVYGEPWVAQNAFTIDLIGSAGTPIGSKSFVAGTNLTIGDDFAWFTPDCPPTYALGIAVTNDGATNNTINKVEIDYTVGGK